MDFYCDQVLSGRISVQRLVETEHILAFHHTQPYWPVHLVIIPKRHIASLAALEPTDLPILPEMLALPAAPPTVKEMLPPAPDLCRRITAEHGGCRLSTNSGDYQTTKHLHFYIHH